jgi:hypothetical protein
MGSVAATVFDAFSVCETRSVMGAANSAWVMLILSQCLRSGLFLKSNQGVPYWIHHGLFGWLVFRGRDWRLAIGTSLKRLILKHFFKTLGAQCANI